jgi:hypothetical protein
MIVLHLQTIDTTLTLIQALEQMSPHIGPLKVHMLKRKDWCEKQLAEVQKAQAKGE